MVLEGVLSNLQPKPSSGYELRQKFDNKSDQIATVAFDELKVC